MARPSDTRRGARPRPRIFRRRDVGLFRRGRRQSSDRRLADLASRAGRLDRRAGRAAARSRRVPGDVAQGEGVRRRLLVARQRRTVAAAARRWPAFGARSRPHGRRARRRPTSSSCRRGRSTASSKRPKRRRRSICSRSTSRDTRSKCCAASISARWRPLLILVEDHVSNLRDARYLKQRGYRLIRRLGHNGWYVPPARPSDCVVDRALGNAAQILSWRCRFVCVRNAWRRRRGGSTPTGGRGR